LCKKSRKKFRVAAISLMNCEIDCSENAIKDGANFLMIERCTYNLLLLTFTHQYHKICRTDYGGAENAGVENAGADRTGGKCRSRKCRNE